MKLSVKLGACAIILSVVGGVAACGGSESSAPAVEVSQDVINAVKARQANFSDVGAAFKAISDEMKAGRPDSATVEFSIKTMQQYSNSIDSWFLEGSGPESGLEMEAKANIWSEPEAFAEQISNFKTAVAGLSEAIDDPELLPAKFRAAGGTCKSCHDTFREED